MDLLVLPPHLRHIYTDSVPESSSSQTSSVVFLERPELPSFDEEDQSKKQCPPAGAAAAITDYFGNRLEWSPSTSSFTPPIVNNSSDSSPRATHHMVPPPLPSPSPTSPLESREIELETELKKHGGADALVRKIITMEGLKDWDRLARYALQQSSFSQQSSVEFCKTLDECVKEVESSSQDDSMIKRMESIREKERKLVQWWLEIRGDKLLVA